MGSEEGAEGTVWVNACHAEVRCWFVHLRFQP